MSSVSGLGAIVQILRANLERSELAKNTRTSGSGEKPCAQPGDVKLTVAKLERQITEKLNVIKQSEDFQQQALRVIVDSVLSWEWGDSTLVESKFVDLSIRVQQAIMRDPKATRLVSSVLSDMLQGTK